ncbi:anaerobic ribonucleoside-triphosphate reductase activating protein [Massilia sp. TS11]|nr:anaerobic ribonucleoside-triphosphate reductase activating protein [Massilia sp. TS11]
MTPFSATDYPGKLAAVLFVQGCPWRCGYCHNPHLQARTAANPVDWAQLKAFLARRVGLVDAVVFSGGEPTIDPRLADAMADVRALGFGIGLHTACIYPERLRQVLPQVDWVGFDVKGPFADYARITGSDAGAQVRASVETIIASGVAHECRTTTHPQLHSPAMLMALARELASLGVRHYALQHLRPQGCPSAHYPPVPSDYPGPEALRAIAAEFTTFTLRPA